MLFTSDAFLTRLSEDHRRHLSGKKTLIFSCNTLVSKAVEKRFRESGHAVRHLDHKTPPAERKQILEWFRKTRAAVLTSVSLLSTGFDEPSVEAVVLYRATTSLTLYHR